MNSPEASTSSKRSRSVSRSGAYCALTSTSGICTARKATRPASADQEIGNERDEDRGDRVVDVVELLVERLPARAERPADARERETPDRRPQKREDGVAPEGEAEDAGGNRDEGARDGRDPPDEDGRVAPPVEPVLGAREPMRRQVQPAAAALQERAAAVPADR